MNFVTNRPDLILLVEDDLAVATLLSALLRRAGFEVCRAATAQHGMALALEQLPTLAVLDIDLPDFSGLELCRQLKADVRTAPMPVVFCTGNSRAKSAANAAGGTDFVTKPYEAITLPERIRRVLNQQGPQACA